MISRIERPKKTKIGLELAHVTLHSDTTFKVKRSKVNLLVSVSVVNRNFLPVGPTTTQTLAISVKCQYSVRAIFTDNISIDFNVILLQSYEA